MNAASLPGTPPSPPTSPIPDGILLIDKPIGPTSYDMIRWAKRVLKGAKLGHSGTLDPLASGLLILLINRATKRQSELMGLDKVYRCLIRFGIQTDSADITGKVIAEKVCSATDDEIINALKKQVGPQMQVPPMYSAVKKDGVPLYKLARKGKSVEREARSITIHSTEMLTRKSNSDVEILIHCSSGTYVRTLVESIGDACGERATVAELRRERIGSIDVKDALPGDQMKQLDAQQLIARFRPVPEAL